MKVKTKKKSSNFSPLDNSLRLISLAFLGLVSLLSVTFISYQLAYHERIYPGVKISNISIGNKTPQEAKALLQKELDPLKREGVSFSFNNEVKTSTLEDLGVSYDLEGAVGEAYRLGRQPNLIVSLGQKIKAWTGYYNLSPRFSYNNQKFTEALEHFNKQIAEKPVEAKISFPKNQVVITPPQEGQSLDFDHAKAVFVGSLQTFSVSPIMLTQKTLTPQLTAQEAESYRETIATLLNEALKLTFQNRSWELKGNDLAVLLTFTPQKGGGSPLKFDLANKAFEISRISVNQSVLESQSELALNQEELRTYVTEIASDINQEPVDAKFNFTEGRVSQFSSHRDGQSLDEDKTVDMVNETFASVLEKSPVTEISLPVTVTKAKVTTESVNNLGIRELIGVGTSKFAGSIPNRAANVGLASNRVNGTLVPPGEVFSMYKTIGEVDGSTGYKEAYIISKGRTQLDFGGGVCQVSTTLFRAALNTGLPIVERHPHAYRVGYYEQNSSAGIDASVFFPYSDFRFRNDTSHHILIQTKFSASTSTLTFEFYGTKDGREVVLTKPTLTNLIPAPPELHQEDPTLPAGTVKQVDFAASGATASFKRTVTKGGEVLHQDTFFSKYAPWQAIFLHGTKVG